MMFGASTAGTGFHAGLVLTALGFGFRHGIDWDHIAALTDITGAQASPRQSMRFATLYACGHALVVSALGAAAIVFAERLPPSVDIVMERFVGATLIMLGLYVGVTLLRERDAFRMRSRWMLLFSGARRAAHWVGRLRRPIVVEVEHSHPHDHADDAVHRATHSHSQELAGAAIGGSDRRPLGVVDSGRGHRHLHRHVGEVPADPFKTYGPRSAFGVGMIHGVGAETPTQLLIFLAAAGAGGKILGLTLLGCFLVGLLVSNTLIAVVGTYGFLSATRNFRLYVAVSALTATFSLVIGSAFVFGRSATLPAFFGG